MAKEVLKGKKIYHNGYDISSNIGQIDFPLNREALDVTGIDAENSKEYLMGQKDYALKLSGLWEGGAAAIDAVMHGGLDGVGQVTTVCVAGDVDGAVAYALSGGMSEFKLGGPVGKAHGFSGAVYGQGVAEARGTIMMTGAKTESADGVVRELGAVSSSQYLYGILQVIDSTGDGSQTLDVKIQNDTLESFTSPADRMTFTQFTTDVGAEWATAVAGPLTDGFWRVVATIADGGASVSFTFNVIIAILTKR